MAICFRIPSFFPLLGTCHQLGVCCSLDLCKGQKAGHAGLAFAGMVWEACREKRASPLNRTMTDDRPPAAP